MQPRRSTGNRLVWKRKHYRQRFLVGNRRTDRTSKNCSPMNSDDESDYCLPFVDEKQGPTASHNRTSPCTTGRSPFRIRVPLRISSNGARNESSAQTDWAAGDDASRFGLHGATPIPVHGDGNVRTSRNRRRRSGHRELGRSASQSPKGPAQHRTGRQKAPFLAYVNGANPGGKPVRQRRYRSFRTASICCTAA